MTKPKFKVGDILKVINLEQAKGYRYPKSGIITVEVISDWIGSKGGFAYHYKGAGNVLPEHLLDYAERHLLNLELKELYE